MRFSFCRHNPGPKLCISHFSRFSVFLAIFWVIQFLCLIFHVCQFSRRNPGPKVCIFTISGLSLFLAIFQVLQCVFLSLHFFQCFLPYFKSYHLSFSFSSFFSFLAIYQVLQCEFPFFFVCQCSHHIPCPRMFVFHYLVPFFSTYSRSYSVPFSFFTFFSAIRHFPGHTVIVSQFPRLSIFLPQSRS